MNSLIRFSVLFIIVLCFSGCGGQTRPDGMPPLVPCSVLVTQEGVPLSEANVTFIPEDGSRWSAAGTTNADGIAVLYTLSRYKGVVVGDYKTVVSKTKTIPGTVASSASYERSEPDKSFLLVEKQYDDPSVTPLRIQVVKGTRDYKVDLGKAVKIRLPER
jgi:hypothetical protein